MIRLLLVFTFALISFSSFAQHTLSGRVVDAVSRENLTGASVAILQPGQAGRQAVAVGLDGTFVFRGLRSGQHEVTITFEGYQPLTERIDLTRSLERRFELRYSTADISEVQVVSRSRGTDAEARNLERLSPNVINIISAKQIELSPDITVANVIQRVSGLSIERNANGDPQYAVVRGMNKRYNNTLVNGIKIPSPDNDNRFVPLDIFPAVFLDRLEVYKSLSADMEADAIGGTVNMVMKDAPIQGRILEGDFQLGYNQMNLDRDFVTYDRSELAMKSPRELYGPNYDATPSDFPRSNMIERYGRPFPDIIANATYGQRFLGDKLGVMVGGSFQNTYRPTSNYIYRPEVRADVGNPIHLRELETRYSSAQQQRMAAHGRLTYDLNPKNVFSLYAGHYRLNEFRVRESAGRQSFASTEVGAVYPSYRFTNVFQTISTLDLNGKHQATEKLEADWNLVYSHAKNDRPDDGIYYTSAIFNGEGTGFMDERPYFQNSSHRRLWERNTDENISSYLNFTYNPGWINEATRIKFGGVSHLRTRTNYYNYYIFNRPQSVPSERGVDWHNYGDIPYDEMATPRGSGNASNLIYDSEETTVAYYVNTGWQFNRSNVALGLRAEHTSQRYSINSRAIDPNADADFRPEATQNYMNLFPSFSFKQLIGLHMNAKATYFRGISRPGFHEIVPTRRGSGSSESYFSEQGNPDLRPTISDNIDVRFEYFPTVLDQILVGAFYKNIQDPIEYGFDQVDPNTPNAQLDRARRASTIRPQNFGRASNFGLEFDLIKYFNQFGIRGNYTYTHSKLTSTKLVAHTNDEIAAGAPSFSIHEQSRALQGQSAHIANLSLLYKNQKHRLDAQVVLNYTGERIALVSPFLDSDEWMRPMTMLDLSVEKGFGSHWVVFAKANNLLNTPYELFVKKPVYQGHLTYPHQDSPNNHTNTRRDLYGESYRLGVRYRL